MKFELDELSEETMPFARELHTATAELRNLLSPEVDYMPDGNPVDAAVEILESDIGDYWGHRGGETVAEFLTDDSESLVEAYESLRSYTQEALGIRDTAGVPPAYDTQWVQDMASGLLEMAYQLEVSARR